MINEWHMILKRLKVRCEHKLSNYIYHYVIFTGWLLLKYSELLLVQTTMNTEATFKIPGTWVINIDIVWAIKN